MTFVWPTQVVEPVQLPRKDASREEVDPVLRFEPAPIPAGASLSSPYLPKAVQGIDMRPRAFCIVEPNSQAAVLDRKRPFVTSSPAAVKAAKKQWQGVSISGRVEAAYLFATSLSVEPFRLGELRLAVLPVASGSDGSFDVLRGADILGRGDAGMAAWLEACEDEFAAKTQKAEREQYGTVVDYLNIQNKLETHEPHAPRVAWGQGGANVRAVVVPEAVEEVLGLPVNGFAVDLNQYFVACRDHIEAHYLCAVLNTDRVNEAIKAVQTVGQQGPRHVHRRPLEEVPIPTYDPTDSRHARLARLSLEAHRIAPNVRANSAQARRRYLDAIGSPIHEAEKIASEVIDDSISERRLREGSSAATQA